MTDKIEFRSGVLRNNLVWQLRFTLLGVAVTVFFWRRYETPALVAAQLVLVVICFVQHAWIVNSRPKLSFGLATVLYLANLAAVAIALWVGTAAGAELPRVWAPFESHRLITVAAPLFAPANPWLGAIGSLLFAATAALQYSTFGPEARANLVEDEPWGTLVFSAFGLVLCLTRMRNQKLMNRELRYRVEAISMRRLNSRLHALRDLTNTPLTTVKGGLALLRLRHPSDSALLDRVDRALNRIGEVNRVQNEEGSSEERQQLSFDARKKLRRRPSS